MTESKIQVAQFPLNPHHILSSTMLTWLLVSHQCRVLHSIAVVVGVSGFYD